VGDGENIQPLCLTDSAETSYWRYTNNSTNNSTNNREEQQQQQEKQELHQQQYQQEQEQEQTVAAACGLDLHTRAAPVPGTSKGHSSRALRLLPDSFQLQHFPFCRRKAGHGGEGSFLLCTENPLVTSLVTPVTRSLPSCHSFLPWVQVPSALVEASRRGSREAQHLPRALQNPPALTVPRDRGGAQGLL